MSRARALARWGRSIVLVVLCVLPACAPAAFAADDGRAPIPAYHGYVNDEAGVIPEQQRAQLEAFLDQVARKTGTQFAVLTVASTAPDEPDAYKVRVFEAWGIGSKEKDDGLLLLLAMQERRMVFETGYGIEGTLPDGWLSSMLRELAVPHLRAGETADAITVAVLAAAQRIAAEKGVTLEWDGKELRYTGDRKRNRPPEWVVLLVLLLILLLVSSAARRRGFRGGSGPWIGGGFGGGWGGGFGGGGGGFGGGGGSFGGFGGGGSGGGGGGANW